MASIRSGAVISFERSQDYTLIRSILTGQNYSRMADDFSPAAEDYQPPENPDLWYVLVKVRGVARGVWVLAPHNHILYEVHTCLLPEMWGEPAAYAAKKMAEWVWANTPCLRLVTSVPAFNRPALAFAKAAGMVQYGVNPKAYQKNNQLHDLFLLGMSKPEVV